MPPLCASAFVQPRCARKSCVASDRVHWQDYWSSSAPALKERRRRLKRGADFLSAPCEPLQIHEEELERSIPHFKNPPLLPARSANLEEDAFLKRYGGRLLGGMEADAAAGVANSQGAVVNESQQLSPSLVINCLIIGLSAAVQGYDHGAASGALHNLVEFKGLDHELKIGPLLQGWIIASAWVSTVVGTLGCYYIPTPRLALILAAALETLGSLLTGLTPSLRLLIAGRLLNGLGMGFNGVALAQYVSEIAPPSVRGGAIACQETTFVIGALLGAIAGGHWLQVKGGWRRTWGLASFLGTAAFVTMLRMPDTPRSVYRRAMRAAGEEVSETPEAAQRRLQAVLEQARREALSSLLALRGLQAPDFDLMKELEDIEATYASELEQRGRTASSASRRTAQQVERQEELPLLEIFQSPVHRRLLLVGCVVNTFPALVGHEALLNYTSQMFHMVGFNVQSAASVSVGLYLIKLVTTLPDFLWLDSVGRRVLLSFGLAGVTTLNVISAGAAYMQGLRIAGFSMLASSVIYQGAVGPVTWIVSSELYPSDMRARGCTLAAASFSLSTLLSVQFHPLLMTRGPVTVFLTYAMFSQVAWLVSRVMIPETKGRSLEEIQQEAFNGQLFRRASMVEARSALGLEPEADLSD
eukprot:TRINITY_DN40513_c0_g1_i1.p1 TRINITY_DN40513_c0_g1~~TRINITY_DN40513_c0_g1_i1.p1  ORF type:complete len:642 (+),score=105.66 TRINITY_DN40513_c0_g1_i1:33-1958(+)